MTGFDRLEPRRLFAAFSASFNFQPRGETPGGWIADTGASYREQITDQGTLTFGWNVDNYPFMQNRRTDAKLRYDTLAFIGAEGGASKWEVKVPNGLYRVKVMSGDARYTNSQYAIQVEDSTIYNRKPNKTTRWHKGDGLVWVHDGKLTLTNAAGAINNKVNCIEVREVDPHAMAAGELPVANPYSLEGIVQNEVPAGTALPMIQELGAKNVKLWYQISAWDDPVSAWDMKNIAKYKAAGYCTTVTFVLRDPPTYEQAKGFFERVLAYPGAKENIDFWQIGNEPNLTAFFNGTIDQYIQDNLRPAYEVLHPAGEPVISGGVTYYLDFCQQLVDHGFAQYTDYAGFHPYDQSAEKVITLATNAKAIFGNTPMVFSEWNVVWNQWDPQGHARELALAADGIRSLAYMSFYYALRSNDGYFGFVGAFTKDNTPNSPYYETVKDFLA